MLRGPEDALPLPRKRLLVLIIILFVVLVVIREVPIFVKLVLVLLDVFLILLFFFVKVVGDGIQRDRVDLRYLELALTLRAAQDLSLFHFVFVHINFCATFWAAEHVSILRVDLLRARPRARLSPSGVLYTPAEEVDSVALPLCFSVTQQSGRKKSLPWHANIQNGPSLASVEWSLTTGVHSWSAAAASRCADTGPSPEEPLNLVSRYRKAWRGSYWKRPVCRSASWR